MSLSKLHNLTSNTFGYVDYTGISHITEDNINIL